MKTRPVELASRIGSIFWYSADSVPALRCRGVGEFEDDDPFRLGSAFKQLGGGTPGQIAATVLRDRGGDRRAIRLISARVGDLKFRDEIGRHFASCCGVSEPRSLRVQRERSKPTPRAEDR